MLPSRGTRIALVAVLALLGSLLLVVAPTGSAQAADDKGLVTGVVSFPQRDRPKLQLLWFDKSWKYLGRKNATAGSYAVNLAPGTYHLQFIDQRQAYDIKKYAPTDVQVTVRANEPTIRNVTMKRGGYITGTIRTGKGKPAKGARVVAANRAQASFETTANAKGQFAVGGLPEGNYSVFTWDKKHQWVAKSTFAGKIKSRKDKDIRIRLGKRAGAMRVLLYTPKGTLSGKTSVTVTSRATGQWWTATSRNGTAVFEGLYPGTYTLKFDGHGVWLPHTATIRAAHVKSARTVLGKFKISHRGGWVTGKAVDGGAPSYPIKGAQVQLYSRTGQKLDEVTATAEGWFTLDGQLLTQSGATVVVNPPASSGGYVQTVSYCQFQPANVSTAITKGKETALGQVLLARSPGQGVQCS